jgi:hypothetical protein
MPLRVIGVPIPTVAGAPPTIMLNVSYNSQEQTQWCWAACAEMVFRFDGNDIKQCVLATEQFGGRCCNSPSSSICNQPGVIVQPYDQHGYRLIYWQGYLSLEELQARLETGRPVEVRYSWYGGGAHVAVVSGYYDDGDLMILDPWYGPGRRKYSFVVAGYGLGSWTDTYTNIHKAQNLA